MNAPRSAPALAVTLVALLAGTLALSVPAPASAGTWEETTSGTYSLGPGGSVSIKNTNGRLVVEAWDGNEVELEATKRVRAWTESKAERAFERTEVRVEQRGAALEIETVYEGQDSGLFDWIFGRDHAEVSYRLRVPASVDLVLRTVNGPIEVSEVTGSTELRTTNGRIVLNDVGGEVRATTTNGSVRAELSRARPDAELHLRTTNGGIDVDLPTDWSGNVEASTVNGSVRSELPIVTSRSSRKHLEGRVGDGHGLLSARTVNGGISIGD